MGKFSLIIVCQNPGPLSLDVYKKNKFFCLICDYDYADSVYFGCILTITKQKLFFFEAKLL